MTNDDEKDLAYWADQLAAEDYVFWVDRDAQKIRGAHLPKPRRDERDNLKFAFWLTYGLAIAIFWAAVVWEVIKWLR